LKVFLSISISNDVYSTNFFCDAFQVYFFKFHTENFFVRFDRTIGFCCDCCCCCGGLPCCQNPDSLYDPCGSQYSTLQYLLRKQKPVILYANFLGAFGRGKNIYKILYFANPVCLFSSVAPFYIAADNDKKTIIVSIRGTLSATDILTDINAVENILETELFGNGHCHSGKKNDFRNSGPLKQLA
jgi:hypothetical protein